MAHGSEGGRLKRPVNRVKHAVVQRGIERHAEFAMVLVSQGHEAKWLKTCALQLARGRQHFSHGVNGTGAAVKGYFYEIARGELMLHLQQPAGNGNRLKFCARALAALSMNGSSNRSIELYSGRTPVGVGLGEVGHSHLDYAMSQSPAADYQSTWPRAYA